MAEISDGSSAFEDVNLFLLLPGLKLVCVVRFANLDSGWSTFVANDWAVFIIARATTAQTLVEVILWLMVDGLNFSCWATLLNWHLGTNEVVHYIL